MKMKNEKMKSTVNDLDTKIVIEGSIVNILEKIKIAREKDREVVRVMKEIKKVKVKVLREGEWQVERNLILKKKKMYISKNEKLRVEIIQLYHNMPAAEHRER